MKLLNSFQLATRFYSNGASILFFVFISAMTWIRPMVKSRPSM